MSALSGEEEPENYEARDATLEKHLPKTDEVTGALTYDYPIDVPAGRNGMTSEISLRYNSIRRVPLTAPVGQRISFSSSE